MIMESTNQTLFQRTWNYISTNKLIILIYSILLTFISIIGRVYLDIPFLGGIAFCSGIIAGIILIIMMVYSWIINPITAFLNKDENE